MKTRPFTRADGHASSNSHSESNRPNMVAVDRERPMPATTLDERSSGALISSDDAGKFSRFSRDRRPYGRGNPGDFRSRMPNLLARIGLSVLASAALAMTAATPALADPPLYKDVCKGPVQIAPGISTTTCMHARIYAPTVVYAEVKVQNSSPYTVTARADVLIGATTYIGNTDTIEPGNTEFVFSNSVYDPPGPDSTWVGRGDIAAGGWRTYTYSQ